MFSVYVNETEYLDSVRIQEDKIQDPTPVLPIVLMWGMSVHHDVDWCLKEVPDYVGSVVKKQVVAEKNLVDVTVRSGRRLYHICGTEGL